MSSTVVSAAVLLLAMVMATPSIGADEPSAYLTDANGRKALKEPLTVREQQEGFAGMTGTIWDVGTDGKWKVSRFRRNRDGTEQLTPLRSGTLSSAEIEGLAKSLAEREFAALPAKTGEPAKVNAHTLTIGFGKKTAKLEGLPARRVDSLADHVRTSAPVTEKADASVWARFAHIAEAVESRCKAPEKTP
jgi:hypothetical protein